MSLEAMAAGVFSAGVAYGLLVVVGAVRGRPLRSSDRRSDQVRRDRSARRADLQRLVLAVGLGLVVLFVTRWPVAGAFAVALVFLWPRIFGGNLAGARKLEQLEAIATWTESMRDTSLGNAGLEQAIPATAHNAPAPIRPQLLRLAGALAVRVDMKTALHRFADEVHDEICDVVVAGLLNNAQLRGPRLAAMLGDVAAAARDELAMRQRVETERRGLRRQTRIIVCLILGFIALQAVVARTWVEPYQSVAGQAVLALLLMFLLGAFMRMRALSDPPQRERILAGHDAGVAA